MNALHTLVNRLGRDNALNLAFVGMTIVLGATAWSAVACLQNQLSDLEQNIANRESLLERGEDLQTVSQRLNEQLSSVESDLNALQAKLPETPEESQFLHDLAERALATGVSLSDFRPGAITQRPNCKDIDLRLRGTGPYASLCRWLHELRGLPRFVRISHMSIAGPTTAGGDCLIDIQLSLIFGVKTQSMLNAAVK